MPPYGRCVFDAAAVSFGLRPSQALRASSPKGGAKTLSVSFADSSLKREPRGGAINLLLRK